MECFWEWKASFLLMGSLADDVLFLDRLWNVSAVGAAGWGPQAEPQDDHAAEIPSPRRGKGHPGCGQASAGGAAVKQQLISKGTLWKAQQLFICPVQMLRQSQLLWLGRQRVDPAEQTGSSWQLLQNPAHPLRPKRPSLQYLQSGGMERRLFGRLLANDIHLLFMLLLFCCS